MVKSREVQVFDCERKGCKARFEAGIGLDEELNSARIKAEEHEAQDAIHILVNFKGQASGYTYTRSIVLRTIEGNQLMEQFVPLEQLDDRLKALRESLAERDEARLVDLRTKQIKD